MANAKTITENVTAFSSIQGEATVTHKDFIVKDNNRNKKLFYKNNLVAFISNIDQSVCALYPFERKHVPIIKSFLAQNGFEVPLSDTQEKLYAKFLARHLTDPGKITSTST